MPDIMPGHVTLDEPLERQLLAQLGMRLRAGRQERKMTSVAMAKAAGVSRSTLYAAEAGDPSTSMGTYVRILGALGRVADLALVAGLRAPSVEVGRHAPQDLQSLLMHREAVRMLRDDPGLVNKALSTLERWRSNGDPRSFVLMDEWRRILLECDWSAAVQETERGNQLRQASPLSTLLPDEVRLSIISKVKAMKQRGSRGAQA